VLWRFEGLQSFEWNQASHIVAGIFNSNRTKASDRWWTLQDFHPLAVRKKQRPMSGNDVNAKYTQHLKATGQDVQWLEDTDDGE